jgi:signal peptidase I
LSKPNAMPGPLQPNAADVPTRQRWTSRIRTLGRWIERGLAVFGGLVILYWLTFDYSIIVSRSMSPTLKGTNLDNGDRVITEKVTRWFRAPRRWEVITFLDKEGMKVMKRVAGLRGENVQMRDTGHLLIDGREVQCSPSLDLKYMRFGNLMEDKPVPCGDGYYVLGDELKDSDDSRFNGPVPARRVMGRAWLIVWPWKRAGWIR